MIERYELLYKHLHRIGHTLEEAPRTNTVRAQTALEIGADLALVKDVEKRQNGVKQQQSDADQQALDGSCEPGRHRGVEHLVEPCRKRVEIIYGVVGHNNLCK